MPPVLSRFRGFIITVKCWFCWLTKVAQTASSRELHILVKSRDAQTVYTTWPKAVANWVSPWFKKTIVHYVGRCHWRQLRVAYATSPLAARVIETALKVCRDVLLNQVFLWHEGLWNGTITVQVDLIFAFSLSFKYSLNISCVNITVIAWLLKLAPFTEIHPQISFWNLSPLE